MRYINTETNDYPLYFNDIARLYPDVSFSVSNFQPPDNFQPVVDVPQPSYNILLNIVEDVPTNVYGIWYQQWKQTDATSEQVTERLNTIKDQQIANLTLTYSSLLYADISYVNSTGLSKTYDTSNTSLILLQQAILGFQGVATTPDSFYWLSTDNAKVTFTYQDLLNLSTAIANRTWNNFEYFQCKKDLIKNSTNVDYIRSINW